MYHLSIAITPVPGGQYLTGDYIDFLYRHFTAKYQGLGVTVEVYCGFSRVVMYGEENPDEEAAIKQEVETTLWQAFLASADDGNEYSED